MAEVAENQKTAPLELGLRECDLSSDPLDRPKAQIV